MGATVKCRVGSCVVSLGKDERGWSIETSGGQVFGCILSTGVLYFPTF